MSDQMGNDPLNPDGDPRTAAIHRLRARRSMVYQAGLYLVLSVFFVVIWAFSDGGFFWPIFPIFGFVLALLGQARVFWQRPITEDDIQREMGRGGPA